MRGFQRCGSTSFPHLFALTSFSSLPIECHATCPLFGHRLGSQAWCSLVLPFSSGTCWSLVLLSVSQCVSVCVTELFAHPRFSSLTCGHVFKSKLPICGGKGCSLPYLHALASLHSLPLEGCANRLVPVQFTSIHCHNSHQPTVQAHAAQ
jgi:hypothetical protein